ncbi:hypothetical protein MNBD_PLANCTO03-2437 [hydrothermal vent metagenome]|uniref:Terminase large subunit gp17-like C-terminal domain-containing protein n=1 Tax=hydrothermal vent metagenome TaxID=652676 RepID=A0A3B1DWJ3_9ZZZZ
MPEKKKHNQEPATETHEAANAVGVFPDSPDALHAWLKETLGLTIAQRPIIRGHQAPFAYLSHVFFEGGRLLARKATATQDTTATPLDSVVWANRGGGKTFLGAVATMLDLVFKPGVEVRILGGSLEQSKRMHAHLRALFAHPALAPLLDGRITERRVRLTNGSVAEILAQSETSVRGTRVQKLRCDEVELFHPDVWEAAQLTTRSADITLPGGRVVEVRGSIECLSTMHRPYGLMHRIVQEAREVGGGRSIFRWGVVDVLDRCESERPCERCVLLPECRGRAKSRKEPGHIRIEDAVRMKSRVGAATWESEMLCRRPRRTDSVFPEFDRAVHVVGDGEVWQVPKGELLAGMDFGFRAPTVVLWVVHDEAGVLWVVAERVKAETVLEEHARAIVEGPGVEGVTGPPAWIGVDPAGRQRNDQTGLSASAVLRKAGLRVKDRSLGQQAGLSLVRARLKPAADAGQGGKPGGAVPPRLFVHARCEHLIECLERYHYPADRPECLQPEKDGFDHAPDALRYLVQGLDRPFTCKFSSY